MYRLLTKNPTSTSRNELLEEKYSYLLTFLCYEEKHSYLWQACKQNYECKFVPFSHQGIFATFVIKEGQWRDCDVITDVMSKIAKIVKYRQIQGFSQLLWPKCAMCLW